MYGGVILGGAYMRTTFIFVIHFHQPTGQLKWILDRIQRNCYELLLRVFKNYPDIKLTLHFSGPLLKMWEKYYPEYLSDLRELIKRGNIEVLGGSLAESILAIIPWEDRIEQLVRGKELIEELLGVKPRGAWLPERVWDPTLPAAFEEAGYSYVIVDDEVGYRCGLWKGDVHRAWLTEYSGRKVGVFFIDAPIRYILPWRSHDEVLGYLSQFRSKGGVDYVLWGSDAEKFGEWWDPFYAENWLRGFFEKLRHAEWVNVDTPYSYLVKHGYRGLLYLPPGSYDKMMEWSWGYFPNFLRKYAESNNMHKKMLWVRKKLEELDAPEEAWENYYMAQCNDAYWHGLFGGLYLNFLRQAVYDNLIRAERVAEENAGVYRRRRYITREYDFDLDGKREVLVETETLNAYIKPSDGGTLFELDVKLPGYEHNLINTMSRYGESYLQELSGYRPDWYRRVSFREHIWRDDINIWDWVNNTPFADVSDFALGEYLYTIGRDGAVKLHFTGRDWRDKSNPKRIFIEKTFLLDPRGKELIVEYYWRNMEKETLSPRLSIELTLAPRLQYDVDKQPYYIVDGEYSHSLGEPHISTWSRKVEVITEGYPRITIVNEKYGELWIAAINTLSRTEKGVTEMYQALGIVFNHKVVLKPGEGYKNSIHIGVGEK